MEAEKIIKKYPSVKLGLDDHYGRQTVINMINEALSLFSTGDDPIKDKMREAVESKMPKYEAASDKDISEAAESCAKIAEDYKNEAIIQTLEELAIDLSGMHSEYIREYIENQIDILKNGI